MENNGTQSPQPTASTQPGMDVQPPQTSAVNTGWPSAAPPPAAGVGSATTPAPGVAPVVTSAPASAPSPTPAPTTPGMAPAPAAWGVAAAPASPVASPVATPETAPAPDMGVAPAPASTEVAAAPSAESPAQDQAADDHNPMAIPSDTKAKRKAPIGVIVGAIVVAVLLASVAVFAYMKMQKKTTSQKINVPIIGASDVDKTQQQIDESLNGVNDTKDFAASDLSDAALGL